MSSVDDSANNTSESTSLPIKRSAFVYGKRRNLLVDERDAAGSVADLGSTYESTVVAGHKDSLDDQVDASEGRRASPSPPAPSSDDEADAPGTASGYQFDFRRRMQELDEKYDNDDVPATQPQPRRSSPSPSSPPEQSEATGASPMKGVQSVAVDTVPLSGETGYSSEDPFSGSLSPLASSLPAPSTQEQLSESPIIRRRVRGRVKQVVVSDSDAEEQSNSSSVSPVRHSITTPHLRSPPTPPTSEFEMPTTKRKSDKAKGKAPVRDVPPLRFDSEGPASAISRKVNKGKGRESSARPKTKVAPTKKERREAALETSRIAASRPVEIVRTEEPKHTLSSFFANLQHGKLPIPTPPRAEPMSDPIEKFSSPADPSAKIAPLQSAFGAPTTLLAAPALDVPRGTSKRPTPPASTNTLPAAADSSDEEMPEFSSIFQQEQQKRQAEEKFQRLQSFKQAALQQASTSRPSEDDDEDDDLEIVKDDMHVVAREEAAQRRLDKANGSPAKNKAKVLAMGHRSAPKSSNGRSGMLPPPKFSEQNLREFAKPAFVRTGKDGKDPLSKKQLDRMMMMQHEQEKLRLIKQREEEWVQRGGRVLRPDASEAQTSFSQTVGAYAEQGLKTAENGDTMAEVGDEASTDESDDDYTPELRGSASPEPADEDEGVNSDQENEMVVSQDLNQPTDDEADENVAPTRRKSGAHRARVVLESDDEDEQPRPRVLVPDSSLMDVDSTSQAVAAHRDTGSSMESQTEDENDKENSAKLMFDRSDDKENKAVVRHSPSSSRPALGLRTGSLHGLEDGVRRSLSLSSSFADGNDVTASPKEFIRSPLKDISKDDDDPFSFSPSSKSPFTERLLQSAATSPPHASSSKPSLGSPPVLRSERIGRLSQFSFESENDENAVSGFKPLVLQPSFLEILNSQRSPGPSLAPLNPILNGGFSQLFSVSLDDDPGSKKPAARADTDELSLTLDVGLKPALDVSGTLRRKADNIFEKEQEYVVVAAGQNAKPKDVLYVNDHGFLTQTRPEGSSPQVYRMTPSQASKFIGTQVRSTQVTEPLSERAPLRTLSFRATQEESPEAQPLRRLRRRSSSPSERKARAGSASPIAPVSLIAGPSKPNAFDVLGKVTKPSSKAHKEKLQKSEFVVAEAEESDEDDMFGFGGAKKKDDDEEDDDDENKVAEGLVDDAAMDAETVAADLVQEKFREHEEEDDQRLEKLHQDAIEGKFRMKRRDRGVGFEDDSDDDDDDEARRIRQRMYKKRKIEGDDLEALGQNEATRAFYNAYQQDLMDDDDDEFKHLREDIQMGEDDAEAEEPEPREVVSVDEVRQRLREMAQSNAEVEALDPEDTSWIDQSMANDDDDMVRVKVTQQRTGKPMVRRPNPGQVDFDMERPKRHAESDQQRKKMLSWAKGQSNRHQGTGRSANGAAVTGHAKVKSGGGSLRSAQPSSLGAVSETRAVPNKVSKAPSMLSTVSDRSGRFA
ncbi:hypothetical protein HYDPIDRAFT_78205 [Hydnomerulius pinastri MD-312]|nr:hypothetical protein HYDPIDRAFT_78205 [Hydnomerulius pinastri MD-312]